MKGEKNPQLEAIKEVARIFVLAGASAVVAFLLKKFADVPQEPVVVLGTALLRWVDKYLFERGKIEGRMDWTVKGLTRF